MLKHERWLSSVSMVVSLLPLILVALLKSILKPPYTFTDITTGEVHTLSSSALIFAASFCLIPFIIVFVARMLRRHGVLVRNLNTVSIATLVLSVVYICAMAYIVYNNLREMSVKVVVKKIDYMSLACSALCGIFALLSNFLPDLKPNPFFGVKNKKTMANAEVWKKVNGAAASILTHIFLIASVFTAFARGVLAVIVFVLAIFLYYGWIYLYSVFMHNKVNSGKKV